MSKADLAFWLGLYASVIASVTALWALFRELWIDRPRIDVIVKEAWIVNVKGQERKMIVRGESTLQTMGVPNSARRPILEVEVRNRGRRDATIDSVSQVIKEVAPTFSVTYYRNCRSFSPPSGIRHS